MRFSKKLFQSVIKITASCFVLFVVAVFCFNFLPVSAQEPGAGPELSDEINESLEIVGEETGLQKTDPRVFIGRLIRVFLSILGVIALVLVLYGGYLYMTSGGDPEKVGKAKKVLINAIIGLIIILSAYSIASFLLRALTDATGEVQISGLAPGYGLSGGAFGNIIQSHFPMPEQRGVPRNTLIMVTFREQIEPTSILNNDKASACPTALQGADKLCGSVKKTAFSVFRCGDMPTWPTEEEDPERTLDQCVDAEIMDPTDLDLVVNGYAFMTEDRRTIIFNPYGDDPDNHLGSAEEDISYIVHLTSEIRKLGTEQSIFTFAFPDYYWRFTTSTFLDLIPPKVTSVIPASEAGLDPEVDDISLDNSDPPKVYLNQIIVVNFNEPVIPPLTQTQDCTTADSDNEVQVLLDQRQYGAEGNPNQLKNLDDQICTTYHIPGEWKVGMNGYKTIQFTASTKCEGVDYNSCGQPAYCLPANSTISDKILAAQVEAGISMPGTGIMDVAANSLDGNENGRADGQGETINWPDVDPTYNHLDFDNDANTQHPNLVDNYFWQFGTGDKVDLTPPYITALDPVNGTGGLRLDQELTASFSEGLEPFTVDREIKIYGEDFEAWFDPDLATYLADKKDRAGRIVYERDDQGNLVAVKTRQVDMEKVVISHGPFVAHEPGFNPPLFTPVVKSKVRDLRQNCFNPAEEGAHPTDPNETGLQSGCQNMDSTGTSCCPNDFENFDFTLNKKPGEIICSLPGEPVYACSDGADNDDDDKVDYPDDPGCANKSDNDETDLPHCSDGVDNDGDGDADYPADEGCTDPDDLSET